MTKRNTFKYPDGTTSQDKSTEIDPNTRKIVSALLKFLRDIPLEDMLYFLSSIGIRYTLNGVSTSPYASDLFYCKIYVQKGVGIKGEDVETIAEYSGGDPKSIKHAFCSAFAEFLICEDHENQDYHEYLPARWYKEERKRLNAINEERKERKRRAVQEYHEKEKQNVNTK